MTFCTRCGASTYGHGETTPAVCCACVDAEVAAARAVVEAARNMINEHDWSGLYRALRGYDAVYGPHD